MSGKNKPGTKTPMCEICRTKKDVTLAPDPQWSELEDNYTPRYLCDECRGQRAEEV